MRTIRMVSLLYSGAALVNVSWAQLNIQGGVINGGTLSGNVNLSGVKLNGVNLENVKGTATNCEFNQCADKTSLGEPKELETVEHAEAPARETQDPDAYDLGANQAAALPAVFNPHATDETVDFAEKDKNTETVVKSKHGFTSVGVTASNRRPSSPANEAVKQRNFENGCRYRESLAKSNPYANPGALDVKKLAPASELADNCPLAHEEFLLDPEHRSLKVIKGLLYDHWGNYVGIRMYDKAYKDRFGYSGNSFIKYDKGYAVNGIEVIPAGYYKNAANGDIFNSAGKKVGNMQSTGEIRWPEFVVDYNAGEGPKQFGRSTDHAFPQGLQ